MGGSWKDTPLDFVNKGDTQIGHDVWIGNSATIMNGITVGDGAIIGAHALVTKDVAPYTIVGGNSATLIRQRFDDATRDFLLELQWWHWPVEKITIYADAIATGNREQLSLAYEKDSSWGI